MPATRDAFIALFASATLAEEFEANVLSAGAEFLPACAREVLGGGEPTEEYWDFLCVQAAIAAEELPTPDGYRSGAI